MPVLQKIDLKKFFEKKLLEILFVSKIRYRLASKF